MGLVKCVHISHRCMESCGGGLVVARVAMGGVQVQRGCLQCKVLLNLTLPGKPPNNPADIMLL